MIGCGDSYCAALAARSFVMDATGLMVEPVEALEFSRYLIRHVPSDAFVFGISNSGTVSRTIEGVALARERGAWTFAVTVSATNRLAQTAETLVKVNAVPNIKERPDGTRVVTPGKHHLHCEHARPFRRGDRARREGRQPRSEALGGARRPASRAGRQHGCRRRRQIGPSLKRSRRASLPAARRSCSAAGRTSPQPISPWRNGTRR